jgi:hypothetical protein
MILRTIGKILIISLSTWQAASAQSEKETNTPMQSQTQPRTRAKAKAKITVQSTEAKPYEETTSPALIELNLSERFTGDIDGESPVRALQVLRDDKSACLVSLQRFRGKLVGRRREGAGLAEQ